MSILPLERKFSKFSLRPYRQRLVSLALCGFCALTPLSAQAPKADSVTESTSATALWPASLAASIARPELVAWLAAEAEVDADERGTSEDSPMTQADSEPSIQERIVVKGEKTERTLSETLSSVRVATDQEMKKADIRDMYALLNRTANVTSRYGDNGFTIRGIDAVDVSGGGFNGLASVYVDGSVLGRRTIEGGTLSTWDLEQVEVFRGPQSTTQGRNALAGSIFLRSKQPQFQMDGALKVAGGEAGQNQLAFAHGDALIDGRLAYRVSADVREAEGFVTNPQIDTDADSHETATYRAKLLFVPDSDRDLNFLLTLTHGKADKGWDSQRSDVADPFEDRIAPFDIETYNDYSTDIATLEIGYGWSDRWRLSSVTSVNQGNYEAQFDNDLSAQDLGSTVRELETTNITQDLRFHFEGDRTKALIGVYGASLDDDDGYQGRVVLPSAALGIPEFLLPFYPELIQASTGNTNLAETRNFAVYTDFSHDFDDRWTLVGGFRYDRETFDLELNNSAGLISTLPNPADFGAPPYPVGLAEGIAQVNALVSGQIAQANGEGVGDTDFDAFLPKLGIQYRNENGWNAAFTIQRGYRAGGVSVNAVRATADAYDPEYTWNYEASFRANLLDNQLLLSANTFYTDWTDQQITVALSANNFDTTVINAGESRLYGAELELRGKIDRNWDIYAGAGYTNTRFESFVTPDGRDYTGNRFPGAAEWTITAGSAYQHASGFLVQGDVNYLGDSYRNPDNGEIGIQDARTLVNTRIGYNHKHWGLFVYARNLLDEEYVTVGLVREGALFSLGDPRTVGANLQVNW
ncbi:TonB-dependent receptor [Sulfidibacter corallicola]|uniref:TonB-dependent receptor n=1 Tax=Sulfidibacter corallicola TaxID=2818388 RepID=A0A8A4TH13_SULCO|nr:TonB-dependent receptor [Sulfidibacter corallicola]QTD48923.1 TonB-dependent receptor [Sulfidibacter corallicola]